MTKQENQDNLYSCWNKAHDNEEIFILMSRDPAAIETIRFWCQERIRLGLNQTGDDKIIHAEACAIRMFERGHVEPF